MAREQLRLVPERLGAVGEGVDGREQQIAPRALRGLRACRGRRAATAADPVPSATCLSESATARTGMAAPGRGRAAATASTRARRHQRTGAVVDEDHVRGRRADPRGDGVLPARAAGDHPRAQGAQPARAASVATRSAAVTITTSRDAPAARAPPRRDHAAAADRARSRVELVAGRPCGGSSPRRPRPRRRRVRTSAYGALPWRVAWDARARLPGPRS